MELFYIFFADCISQCRPPAAHLPQSFHGNLDHIAGDKVITQLEWYFGSFEVAEMS